jgi:hypothetical protein
MSATPAGPQAPFVATAAQLAAGLGITDFAAIRVADPAVQAAIQYLIGLGAPPPTSQQDNVEPFPGAPFVYSSVTWTNPTTGQTYEGEAGIIAVRPGEAALSLAYIGLLSLPVGYSSVTYAPYQIAALLPQPVQAAPINYPASPVGSPVMPATTGIGANFNPSVTDSLLSHPVGSTWVEDGKGPWGNPAGTYIKGGEVALFGPMNTWKHAK